MIRHSMKKLRWLVLAGAVSLLSPLARGQDFINTGQLNNNGTFIVKRNVNGLPASVGGTFEYNGTTQTVQAASYQNLRLSGSATKNSSGGNFSVNGVLEIAPAVTLSVQTGSVITLGDSLAELGYLSGQIQKTENILSTSQSPFANIGSTIFANGVALGSTNVKRTSGDVLTATNGNQSIRRYYDISASNNKNLNATLVFKFADNELNGSFASSLELWRFNSSDSTWRRQGGNVDTIQRTITKNGIIQFSRWTAADRTKLLGNPEYEWIPFLVTEQSGNRQLVKARTETKPIVAKLVDAYNNPLPNNTVIFSIQSTPIGAVGQRFTADTVITDSLGEARTTFIAGTRPGVYQIHATSASIAPQTFFATAAIVSGDANDDFSSDVADLTSIVAHLRGITPLTGDKFDFADINSDGNLDIKDIDSIRTNILNGVDALDSSGATPLSFNKSNGSSSPFAQAVIDSVTAKVGFELTPTGIRVNMRNTKSIVGIQAYIKFKNPISINSPDVVYRRSQQMDIKIKTIGNELRLVGFNLNNAPISPDSGSLFRLPITLTNLADIESVAVILSTDSNKAIQPGIETILAPTTKYPSTFAVYQNYPNPFNGSTKIEYDIPDVQGRLKIAYLFIYDMLGRKVKTLASGEHEAKRHTVLWDGTDENGFGVASGVYFYQLIGKDFVSSKKMIYIK